MEKNLNVSILLDFYGAMLTEKQREAVEYYYNDDLSLSEIADNQGISRQGVRDAIKRAEALLFEMEECLGFARRFGFCRRAWSKSKKTPGDRGIQQPAKLFEGNSRQSGGDCRFGRSIKRLNGFFA